MENVNFFDELPSKLNASRLLVGQKRMLQIVEGAIQVFSKVGIEEATYAKIAIASHVSRPLIQHYFPSKKQIIEASFKYLRSIYLTEVIDHLNEIAIDCKSTKEFFLEYIKSNFQFLSKTTKRNSMFMHVGFLFFHYSGIDSRIRTLYSNFVRQGTERIKKILERGIADGSFHISSNKVWELARIVRSVLAGALLSYVTESSENLVNIQKDTTNTLLQLVKAT